MHKILIRIREILQRLKMEKRDFLGLNGLIKHSFLYLVILKPILLAQLIFEVLV